MAKANEFIVPDFLSGQSIEYVLKEMKGNLPDDIACCEGDDVWNILYPCAYEIARQRQYYLVEAIKLIWPQFSYGDYALYHATMRSMSIKSGTYATGELLATATVGTVITGHRTSGSTEVLGDIFGTETKNGVSSIQFEATDDITVERSLDYFSPAIVSGTGAILGGNYCLNSERFSFVSDVDSTYIEMFSDTENTDLVSEDITNDYLNYIGAASSVSEPSPYFSTSLSANSYTLYYLGVSNTSSDFILNIYDADGNTVITTTLSSGNGTEIATSDSGASLMLYAIEFTLDDDLSDGKFMISNSSGYLPDLYSIVIAGSDSGTYEVTIPIRAVEAGSDGNVDANTITYVITKNGGIKSVTNPEATSGGTDTESISSLIERMIEYDQNQDTSYIGNVTDYVRWALEIDGVGSAWVVSAQPDEDGNGNKTVTLYVLDSNGEAFDDDSEIFETIYNYIMSPDTPSERLAPIGDFELIVASPTPYGIYISATVELDGTASLSTVTSSYKLQLESYFSSITDSEVKLSRVSALLSDINGVNDYTDVKIGTSADTLSTDNIQISDGCAATVSSITLYEGEVE